MLARLRSSRGGIYYTKSDPFRQIHYVDNYIIYICDLVPLYLIPPSERKCLNTEVDKGLIRGEALDLLGYSYVETGTGKFSISGDLELVCERHFMRSPGLPANFCTNRAKLRSLSTFHIRPLRGI